MTGLNDFHNYDKHNSKGEIIYRELSYKIMNAVFEVHNAIGPGYIESIYEEALFYEIEARGIQIERQKVIDIYYKEHWVGQHRLDLVVENKVILELKAVSAITDGFKQQTRSYLKATGLKLGILINFGTPRVEYYRIVNDPKQKQH